MTAQATNGSSDISAASEVTPSKEKAVNMVEMGRTVKIHGLRALSSSKSCIDLALLPAVKSFPVERNIVEVRKLLSKFADHNLHTDLLVLIIENMRKKKVLTDMIFVCQECGELSAHRAVVSVMSSYCQSLFEKDPTATSVTLPLGITTDSMKRILEFIYTGELPIPDSLVQVREMMKAAHFLKLSLFDEAVAIGLKRSLTLSNFRNVWEMAEEFSNTQLINAVLNTISKDFQSLGNHWEMNDLTRDQLLTLLCSPCAKANPPEEILEAVLSWVHRDSNHRICEFENRLLQDLPFDKMPVGYLRNLLETESLVKKCPKFGNVIENSISFLTSPRDKTTVQLYGSHSLESPEGDRSSPLSPSCYTTSSRRPATAPPDSKEQREVTSSTQPPKRAPVPNLESIVCIEDESSTISFPTLYSSPTNSPPKPSRSPSPAKQHRPNVSPPKRDLAAKQKPKTGGSPNNTSQNELRIFIFGRKRKGEPALQSCLLPSCAWGPAVDLPTTLPVNAAAAVYQNHIYFSGGNDWLLEAVDDFTVYNIRLSTIKKLCPLNWARSLPASAVLGWYIYVIGGLKTNLQGSEKVERYNVFSETWETRAPLPYAAGNITAVAVDIRLYCFGGCRKTENSDTSRAMDWINECCYYDHEVNQWTMIGSIPSGLANGALVLCSAATGEVYVSKCVKPDALWSFDLTTCRWKYHCGSTNNNVIQHMLALIPQDDKIWAIDYAGKMFLYDVPSQSWAHESPFTHSIPCPTYAVVADCNE